MKKALFLCVLVLAALYGVRYWLDQGGSPTETELVLKIQEGTDALKDRVQSDEFRAKVTDDLREKGVQLGDEAKEQWAALKQIAQDGLIRLKGQDMDLLRDVTEVVSREAESQGERITFEESRMAPPPANWMVAAVTNLILAAWISLAVLTLWGVARFVGRRREGD